MLRSCEIRAHCSAQEGHSASGTARSTTGGILLGGAQLGTKGFSPMPSALLGVPQEVFCLEAHNSAQEFSAGCRQSQISVCQHSAQSAQEAFCSERTGRSGPFPCTTRVTAGRAAVMHSRGHGSQRKVASGSERCVARQVGHLGAAGHACAWYRPQL